MSARRDRFADYWDDTRLVERVAAAGTTVLHGYGRLTGEHAVSVTTADGKAFELTARHAVVLATGNRQAWPDIDGLAVSEPWTNREATAASDVPECLLVLGGGAVGCELATAWTAFGSRVTLVQRARRLLPAMEPHAGEAVAAELRARGAEVRLGVTAVYVRRDERGHLCTTLSDGSEIETQRIVLATGRIPATADIGLDTVGQRPGMALDTDGTTRGYRSGRRVAVWGRGLHERGALHAPRLLPGAGLRGRDHRSCPRRARGWSFPDRRHRRARRGDSGGVQYAAGRLGRAD